MASLAAFLVNARNAMLLEDTPLSRALSNIFNSVVVLPVPGGPNILNISELSHSQQLRPNHVSYKET